MMQISQQFSGTASVPDTGSPDDSASNTSKVTIAGSLLAGIAASACCIGPLLLLSLGIGGTWIGNLTAMATYRPYLIGLTVVLLMLAFRKLYLLPQNCKVDSACAIPDTLKKQRIIFWVVSIFLLVMITFPYYGFYLLN